MPASTHSRSRRISSPCWASARQAARCRPSVQPFGGNAGGRFVFARSRPRGPESKTPPGGLGGTSRRRNFQPGKAGLRDRVLPGRSPKHECVFLAWGAEAARDVWFCGHEGGSIGKNRRHRSRNGPRPWRRARGKRWDCREDGAPGRKPHAGQPIAAFISRCDPWKTAVKDRVHHKTHDRHERELVYPLLRRAFLIRRAYGGRVDRRAHDIVRGWQPRLHGALLVRVPWCPVVVVPRLEV